LCYGGLRKEELPKPYSSLQAVDLNVHGEDEHRQIGSLSPQARGAMTYLRTAMSALSGKEYERKCFMARTAYEHFRERLLKLKDDPSGGVWI
jgi:hypothetical protein